MGQLSKKLNQLEREIESLRQQLALAKLQAIKDRRHIYNLKNELSYLLLGDTQRVKSP